MQINGTLLYEYAKLPSHARKCVSNTLDILVERDSMALVSSL